MKRWVEMSVKDSMLFYFKTKKTNAGQWVRCVNLREVVRVRLQAGCQRKFCFSLDTKRRVCTFYAASQDEFDQWFVPLLAVVEENKKRVRNVRNAVLCFLAIKKFRSNECEWVGAASKDVIGIIVGLVWKSQFELGKIWSF